MANILMARGGTPDFKATFCDGQFAEFTPPYDAPHLPATPPFDSHADAAYGQGYLNLHFPLVPNLNGTRAHAWMQTALKKVKDVNDVILLNWVPLRAFVDALYLEVSKTDAILDGVYFKPVAYRARWNFTTESWEYVPIAEFSDEITAAGITQLPLGTPAAGDKLYAFCRLGQNAVSTTTAQVDGTNVLTDASSVSKLPSTFGHNLVARDAQGKPIAGLDAAYGAALLGIQITEGDPAKIANMWQSNIAVYLSAKLLAFEGASQVA